MKREYLRVTPTSEELPASKVSTVLASLHKLTTDEASGLLERVNPLKSAQPLRFEFLAISEGRDAPVEFYYGADDHLDILERRLRSIYPSTFDINPAEIDPATKLIPPTEYEREEFRESLDSGQLLYEFSEDEQVESDSDTSTEPDSNTVDTSAELSESTEVGIDSDADTVVETETGLFQTDAQETGSEGFLPTSVRKPTLTTDGTILARQAIDYLQPIGVRWCGVATRKDDWMTTLTHDTDSESTTSDSASESTGTPLAALIDELSSSEHPIGFQALFQRRPSWVSDAELRQEDLKDGRDTWSQRWIGPLLEGESIDTEDRELGEIVEDRIKRISEKDPKRTFTVNLRAVTVLTSEDATAKLESKMESLAPVFDPLDGKFYEVEGQRFRHAGWRQKTKTKNARKALKRILNRELLTDSGKTRPDLVLNADELANFILVPSSEQLSVEGVRGTRAEQRSRNPLPRPHPDLMREFRDGMAIGYALDEDGEPEDIPVHIPSSLLPVHYGIYGTTGSGKSILASNSSLSLYENTSGPTILIDRKGDGMATNYMRAHARRFGMTDLEENVIHFDIPNTLPGFSFFNLTSSLANGRRRVDAVQRKADHYEEILKLAMGEDKYDRVTVSNNLMKTLIKALFDEEHGRENGVYRESVDYFAHRQLENAVDQLQNAGPPNPDFEQAPQSSDEEDTRMIRRQLDLDERAFKNVVGGVGNRLAYISQNSHLRRVFNNTENRFDFRDILDEDTVIIFDLGDLRDDGAHLMTGLILSNLQDALKERKQNVGQYPDDYVVNLFIDEAASLVVSDIMNDLLEKGRSFRLSVGLAMQFPEQIESAGGRRMYLNVLNNIGSSLVGNVNVDRELARAMAHEEMDPDDFANRIRSLPRGEWIANLPSPTFGKTGPYPFSLKPLPIPAGHPESDHPLTPREEQQFTETLSAIHERVQEEYGVPETTGEPRTDTPAELHDILDISDDELDVAISKVVRSIQLREDVREENGLVAVETVDDELRYFFEDVDADAPSYEELAAIRQRSRFLETTVDIDTDEIVIRLTEAGEDVATPDTGSVQAAGGSDHDDALLEIEAELTALGFTVTILSQDGSEKPDARATHPDIEETFAIEVETTTPENPVKVLTNFQKAQKTAEIPLFIVRPGSSKTAWAERVEGILSPPVRHLQSGETQFYTHDSNLTFNGGATEDGGVTAVRPIAEETDTNRTVWVQEDDCIILRDETGTEHLRTSSIASVTKDRVPAIYSYDQTANEYLVHARGETSTYESKAAFEENWVPVKKPFVPEDELPHPTYGNDAYGIVILPMDGDPVFYRNGTTSSIQSLLDTSFTVGSPDSFKNGTQSGRSPVTTEPETPDEPTSDDFEVSATPLQDENWKEDPDAAIGRFAAECVREDEAESVTSAEVYTVYETWADTHDVDPDSKSWFGRRLGNHVTFERTTERKGGSQVRCYDGIALQQQEEEDE
ncbi:helicase HerA domain-containing protein [Halorussus lipolyticus]|uniref:helicase HerA domain-containing protein n=1 Tax=Halorussus lipolyticus TaxID=3034024 RepID=UPI0023E7A476|nr:DUF87 domain-containing protein [Halorussus sp. DT80]